MTSKLPLLLLALLPGVLRADADLLFLEAQAVFGVTSRGRRPVYHSAMAHDLMQKNGIGFDWIHRFSGDNGDRGVLGIQARLVWDDTDGGVEPQVYNLYYRGKTTYGDWWVGHDRIAAGLASYWDTHSDLIGDLSMMGIGFDRDWGFGYGYDTDWGTIAASVTTGSGASLANHGNFLAASRVAYGILNDDNYTVGWSVFGGRTLDIMGTKRRSHRLNDQVWTGVDLAWNDLFLEHKAEVDVGSFRGRESVAALYRLGIRLDDEDQWKLELQPAYTWLDQVYDWSGAVGLSYRINTDWTVRTMYHYRHFEDEHLFVVQLYYYSAP